MRIQMVAAAILCGIATLAGCTPAADGEATPTAAVTEPASPSTSAADSPTPSESATKSEGGCGDRFHADARILASQWSLVVAARGESDETEMAEAASDQAKDLAGDIDDAGCDLELAATAASVPVELSLLLISLTAGVAPEEDQYVSVVSEGNALLSQMGVDDARFIDIDCKGQVDETKDCTAVD